MANQEIMTQAALIIQLSRLGGHTSNVQIIASWF